MAKCMSFGTEFYTGGFETYDSVPTSDRPTSLIQALYSMPESQWEELCESLGTSAEHADPWEVLADLESSEAMSCDGYESPIEVYLSEWVSVTIYE